MFEEIMGRDRMKNSAEKYGIKIRKKLSSDILRLIRTIEVDLDELKWVKKNQERWYPFIGVTVEEIEEFIAYLEKRVTIAKAT